MAPGMSRSSLQSCAAAAVGLYLLLHAFLTLCLVHPHNEHLQDQAKKHLASICRWAQKTASPHVPSVSVLLPVVAAALFILVPPLSRASQCRIITPLGRSPPPLCLV